MSKDQGFEIDKIKQVPPISAENLATGEYVVEQQGIQPNAEVESKEYLQYPNGEVKLAVGPTHEKGGIKLDLPENTKVLSDTLTLTRGDVSYLTKKFDLNFSTKDTYAKAVDKMTKKLGLTKINDEQKDIFEILKKQQKNPSDSAGTNRVNIEYLNNKIYNLEQSKKPLEAKRSNFFDHVFDLQEANKPKTPMADKHFRYGGVSKDAFLRMCEKHGITEEQGMQMMSDMPKYGFGGLTGKAADDLSKKWNGDETAYEQFIKTKEAFSTPEMKSKLKAEYNKAIENENYYTGKSSGKTKHYNDLKGLGEDDIVNNLLAQEERNARLKAHHYDPASGKQWTAKGQNTNQHALDFIKSKGDALADLDFSQGHKGQAAYIAAMNVLGNRKQKGYGTNQTGAPDELADFNGKVSGIDKASTNTTLGQLLNYTGTPKKEEDKKTEEATAPGPIGEPENMLLKSKQPRYHSQAQEVILPPRSQSAEFIGRSNKGLMSPDQLGINSNLQSNATQWQSFVKQTQDLPPSQRAMALAQLSSQQGEQLNNAITTTNIANTQNRMAAEQYNLQAMDAQNNENQAYRLDYTNRALTGLANTDADLRNYIGALNRKHIGNWQHNQDVNSILATNPDMSIDPLTGMPYYDPANKWQVQNNDWATTVKNNLKTT
jgi:hypothetical protein